MDPQTIARQLGIGRILIGTGLTLAPRLTGRQWLGDVASQPSAAVAVRCLGARDLAIGVGLVRALDRGAHPTPWLIAASAADAADAMGTLLAWKHLPPRGRLLTALMATGGALAGARAAQQFAAR